MYFVAGLIIINVELKCVIRFYAKNPPFIIVDSAIAIFSDYLAGFYRNYTMHSLRALAQRFFHRQVCSGSGTPVGCKKLLAISSSPGQPRKPPGYFAAVFVVLLSELGAHVGFLGETYQQVEKNDPENQIVQQVQ
jgi:hypothetical protein